MASLGRASALIAVGTLVSRVTGLLRAMVLVTAIGAIGEASDAFTIANQLPNYVFQVISAGVLTAVIVPQVVQWSGHEDGGRAQLSKLFTLAAVLLFAVTALSLVAAPLLVQVFGAQWSADQHALATAFSYWCLPQVFFYGMFALIGETLNARGVFGPYAWAPIANNIVSIAGFLVFIQMFGARRNDVADWDPAMIAVLAGVATLGIVVQTAVLVAFWRRTRLHLRPDFRWRGMGLGRLGHLASWTFLMLLVGLGVSTVQQMVISGASGQHASATIWYNGWLLYMLPYSLVIMSIGTPYFTRLSGHAAAGQDDLVRDDIRRSTRVLSLFAVVSAAVVMAASIPAVRIVADTRADAVAGAPVLIAFILALVPLAVQFIVQRTFYAYGDTRTPFFFTLAQASVAVLLTLAAQWLLPAELLAAGVALAQAVSSMVQVVLASWLLHRRLGTIGMSETVWAIVRFSLAAMPAAAAGVGVFLLSGGTSGWMLAGMLQGVLGTCTIGAVVGGVYLAILALFRTPELTPAFDMVRRLVRR
jgi:putative peptidoglycan lipid II flippase